MRHKKPAVWAVYSFPMKGSPDGVRAVCEEGEWEAMDRAKPGFFTLVQAGIEHEGEAERLARGTSGAAKPRNSRATLTTWPGETAVVGAGVASPVAG